LAVRGIQVLFSLTVMILSAYVANWYNTSTIIASPPHVNAMLVSAIFSLLSVALLELLPKFVPFFSNPYLHLAIESANALFWLGSGVALAVFLGRLLSCRGGVCAAAQADAVFAYVMFVAWLGTLVPLAMGIVKGGG
ncbi:marvel domain-containing protein, partial [Schizothecium vesticola]